MRYIYPTYSYGLVSTNVTLIFGTEVQTKKGPKEIHKKVYLDIPFRISPFELEKMDKGIKYGDFMDEMDFTNKKIGQIKKAMNPLWVMELISEINRIKRQYPEEYI